MNFVRIFLSVVFLHIMVIGYSQSITINGHISDMQGNNLFAVNVYLLNQPAIGTTADLNGNFTLDLSKLINLKNEYLVFSFVGYNQLRLSLDSLDYSKHLKIALHENNQTINEVVVKGRKSISREFSIKELDKMKIYLSPLASADPLKAIAMLPSSTNTSETANPELRGSSASRTKVFFNGVPVTNPVRNSQLNGIGFFSLFNPEMVKNEFVYPSNPPLIYGNTSAGTIDIETEDKLESNNFQVSTTLASVGLNVSRLINKKSFIQIYGNFMFSDDYLAVNPIMKERLKNFYSKDFGLNYHNELTDNISLNFYNYLVSESAKVLINLFTWQDYTKSSSIRDFSILNLKYHKASNHLSLNVGTNFSNSHYSFGNIKSINKQNQVYLSVNFKHIFRNNLSFQTGISNEKGNYSYNYDAPSIYYAMSPNSPIYHTDTVVSSNIPEVYLYVRWNPFSKVILGFGVRKNIEVLPKKNPEYISFQTNIRYNIRSYQSLIFSIGKYNNIEEPNYYRQDLRLLSAKHYSLEYLYEKKNTIINLAAYYKHESGDIEGDKKIKGVEIYLERNLSRKLKASISNTILNSELSIQDRSYNSDNNVGYFLVTTLSYANPRFVNFSVSWSNRQGKFYTPIIASNYNPAVDFYEPVYGSNINSNRFGNYNTINLSVSRMITIQKNYIIVFVSVFNLLNTRNQKDLTYNRDYSNSSFDYYQKRAIYFGCVLAIK